ncbi:MAG TPA: LysR family transcriptional regulator [Polyangiaceae bacterium]|nr:LysR family transcriptional regulator [Polyangiaceae bacterium]
MDIPWDDLQVFLAVAEGRSMSAAARRLRMGQPTVSRRVAALEHRLGYALFRRNVEGVLLTAAGERLVSPARRMAEWAGEVTRASSSIDHKPEGLVRITAPPVVAWDFLAPFAGWLRRKHGAIRLEVLSDTRFLDLGRGEADLALRTNPANQADLVTVASFEHSNAIFGAKDYVARLPRRFTLADLDWICWAPPYEDLTPNPQLAELVPGFVPAFTSDSYLVQRQAAEAGLGVIALGDWRHRFARPTALVPLKLDLGAHARSATHLVCAKSALDIPRVRLVAEVIAEALRAPR